MSAPQATTDTNNILPGLCECLGAQNPAWPRAWPDKRAGPAAAKPIRDAVTPFDGAAINESARWRLLFRV
jgi:hypothetical protein